jgi:hypothetical protein
MRMSSRWCSSGSLSPSNDACAFNKPCTAVACISGARTSMGM